MNADAPMITRRQSAKISIFDASNRSMRARFFRASVLREIFHFCQ